MRAVPVIAGYALQEAIRRRVFVVVLGLTALFVALYGLGIWQVFQRVDEIHPPGNLAPRPFAGATVFGLSMFATLFLGVVRGDAESGLLQPLIVRPVSRSALLTGRIVAAGAVCTAYVAVVYTSLLLLTGLIGHWWPDRIALPAVELAAGLVVGLLGSIGQALGSATLKTASHVASWAVPFEALYQDGLHTITEHTPGFTGFVLRLGPFGGAHSSGPFLGVWVAAYVLVVGALALAGFARRDV